jgi:hypothetical protein
MSHKIIRGRWYINVLNVQALTVDKIQYLWGSFGEELEHILDKFAKYHITILLRDFNAKLGREDNFKPKIGKKSIHEFTIDSGTEEVNFATTLYLSKLKYSQFVIFIHLKGYLLMENAQ